MSVKSGKDGVTDEEVGAQTGEQRTENISEKEEKTVLAGLVTWYAMTSTYHGKHCTLGSGIQERTRSASDKLEKKEEKPACRKKQLGRSPLLTRYKLPT